MYKVCARLIQHTYIRSRVWMHAGLAYPSLGLRVCGSVRMHVLLDCLHRLLQLRPELNGLPLVMLCSRWLMMD